MLSGAKPAAVMVSRNGSLRLFQVGTLRPSLSLPRPVSTTIRRVGVSSTSAWIDILRRPSSVAKCGMSQGSLRISSLLASGRINRVLPIVSSSTTLVILTLPTFQSIRRFPKSRPARLQCAREKSAVEQDVLSGDEAGLGAAEKRASLSEFLGVAEAPGGIELGALGANLLHADTALLRLRLRHAAQPVGI